MSEMVLITGGAGFIGSHIADKLIEKGYKVRVLDALKKPVHTTGFPSYLNKQVEFIYGDVTDRNVLEYALKDVSYIYHLAAYQDYLPDFSNFFYTNTFSTALLFELIVQNNLKIKKFIIASSQFVQGEGLYVDKDGKNIKASIREEETLRNGIWDYTDYDGQKLSWLWVPETFANPTNSYAISKFTQELTAINLGKRYEIPSVALRFSIVQGPRQSFYNAYSGACRIFCLSYYNKKAPVIFEDGNQLRDFINIHDVVDAGILVLEKKEANYEVFNVGGGKAISLLEFDRAVAKVFGCEDLAPNVPGEYRFGDTRNACSSIEKLKGLGWAPKRNIIESISEYKEYLEKQENIGFILEYAAKKMKELNVIRKVSS